MVKVAVIATMATAVGIRMGMGPSVAATIAAEEPTELSFTPPRESLSLRVIDMQGITLYKTAAPLKEGPVGDTFPGDFPSRFIQEAWDINVVDTRGGKHLIEEYSSTCTNTNNNGDNQDEDNASTRKSLAERQFGVNLLVRAKEMFDERNLLNELEDFLASGVSNPDSAGGPRRMHWVGITIEPNKSLALHSHPNVEFAYIVEGVMYEWRLTDPSIPKKKSYVPQKKKVMATAATEEDTWAYSYVGPDLTQVDANKSFELQHYSEGEMFINTIGDVHQSFTKEEGVKLFVMWGGGNADIPQSQHPQNAHFLNAQSAQAWT